MGIFWYELQSALDCRFDETAMIKMSMLSDSAFVMTKNNDPVNTELMSLAHFAFCGQVALHLADQDSGPLSPMGQHLFVLRWLVTAQKQKRFPKVVASEIAWLIDRGRRLGQKPTWRAGWNTCIAPVMSPWRSSQTCSA